MTLFRIRVFWPILIPLILLVGAVMFRLVKPVPSRFYTESKSLMPVDANLIQHQPQPFISLPFERRPDTRTSDEIARIFMPPLDADSVELTEVNNAKHYHPVSLAHRATGFITAFHRTQDPNLLRRAQKTAAAIMQQGVWQDSAVFLPYTFDRRIHGSSELLLAKPWFSGMAQGQWLLVMVRLSEITGDQKYYDWSRALFKSLQTFAGQDSIWVCRVDSSGYYWIEEYPHHLPDQTLNGFIAAVYGLHEYRQLFPSDEATWWYETAITTLKHYLPQFRRPGERSLYCLGHHHVATDEYQRLHISMMGHLFRMTGDSFFVAMGDQFRSDFDPDK